MASITLQYRQVRPRTVLIRPQRRSRVAEVDPQSPQPTEGLSGPLINQLLGKVTNGVVVLARDSRILCWNETMERLTGLPAAHVIGRQPSEQFSWWSHLSTEVTRLLQDHEPIVAELRVPLQQHEARSQTWRLRGFPLSPISGRRGEADGPCAVLVVEDMSQLIEVKRQLERTESMATFGKLASGVAHELNNPLDGAIRYLNLALERLGEEEVPREYLLHAKEGLNRMAQIIRSLLDFAKQAAIRRPHLTDINVAIDQALVLAVRPAFEPSVRIERALTPDLPRVVGYGLDYAFANVIKNAYDAMPSGGTLKILTHQQNGEVRVQFADTGCGIPDQVRSRLFEPFFTTKPIGKGTGLGLAICKEIIERSEGRIEIESAIGQGTTVTIALPIGRKRAPSEGTTA